MAQTLQKTIEINGTLTSGFDFGKDKVHGSFCQSFGYNTGVSAKFLKSTTVHRKLLRRDSVPFAKGTEPLVNLVQFTGRVLWGGEVHGGLFWQLSFVGFVVIFNSSFAQPAKIAFSTALCDFELVSENIVFYFYRWYVYTGLTFYILFFG
jgi:hypothetical protein